MQAKSTVTNDATRQRILDGFAQAVSARGYAAATIADVVRYARVSKRTFYEHFGDKDECFLAAYEDASAQILGAIALAVDPTAPWEKQIRGALSAYLQGLESRPALARTFLLEIQAAGPEALKARRKVHERFADQIRGFVDEARKRDPSLKPLPPLVAAALVGGINELVLLNVEAGSSRFTGLAEAAERFAMAVLLGGTAKK
jgi:AcrR family transcriptional regulator